MSEQNNMKELMSEIREVTKKKRSVNKSDEINIMKTMLNDPEFSITEYDKNKGYVGKHSPYEESRKFISSIASELTGIESKNAAELANNYQFNKKDATFMVENAKDFVSTYLQTGRKLPIVQSEESEASLLLREIESKEKQVPDGTTTVVPAFSKVICKSKCPKYVGQQHE